MLENLKQYDIDTILKILNDTNTFQYNTLISIYKYFNVIQHNLHLKLMFQNNRLLN